MSLKGKLETVLELKSSPEAFFNVWKKEPHKVPTHTPTYIQSVDLHEGGWDTHGSVKIWQYTTVDGKAEVFKEKVELDEENKTITFVGQEGHVMETFKVFKPIYKLASKGHGCLVTCIIKYEKLNENVPNPDNYMDFMISLTKEIDESLVKS